MKRRLTKKNIREAEELVADTLSLYLGSPKDADSEKLSRDALALSLSILLDFRMTLDPSWKGKRWIRSIDLSSISIDSPSAISGKGTITWVVADKDGEVETSEPFETSFQPGGPKKRGLKYSFSMG